MLTLPPKRRGREQAACWQLLRFAAGLTRPDGTSARVPRQPSPVETTHPHRTERLFGTRILALGLAIGYRSRSPDTDAPPRQADVRDVGPRRGGAQAAGIGGISPRHAPRWDWEPAGLRDSVRPGA